MNLHRRPCHTHHPDERPPNWAIDLSKQINYLTHGIEKIMTDQEHLDSGVSSISASIATAVAELKAAIAAGTPSAALDFTQLDALAAATAAEATADAPVVTPPVE